jgi:hypothetical protein
MITFPHRADKYAGYSESQLLHILEAHYKFIDNYLKICDGKLGWIQSPTRHGGEALLFAFISDSLFFAELVPLISQYDNIMKFFVTIRSSYFSNLTVSTVLGSFDGVISDNKSGEMSSCTEEAFATECISIWNVSSLSLFGHLNMI